MNAAEHFDWAVGRAIEYVELDDGGSAVASLVSDLSKHEGTAGILTEGSPGLVHDGGRPRRGARGASLHRGHPAPERCVVTTRMVRSGRSLVITADDRLVMTDGKDIYAFVERHRLHVDWWITSGLYGEMIDGGTAWTRGGAWVKAIAAAHRPHGAS